MNVNGTHITIIGAARSGVAAACLLAGKGAEVFVSDFGSISEAGVERLSEASIEFEQGGHSDRAKEADFAVVSPGVPTEAPIIQHFLNHGKQVFSEVEVASWYCKSPMVAVTGTNGKTTTVSWIYDAFGRAGMDPILAGNVGIAFSDIVGETNPERPLVLEVSSFQLDHIHRFCPDVSVLLNITPDHMNRYQNRFENYVASKMRIIENQGPEQKFVYGFDDPVVKEQVLGLAGRNQAPSLLPFSTTTVPENGAGIQAGNIVINSNQTTEELMITEQVSLPGGHNLANALATALATRSFEIKNDALRDSLSMFEGVPHRLEFVRDLDGVRFYNDSKATNVNAVWYALESFNVPMVLILGGRDKGNDYAELIAPIRDKVHTVIAIGEARAKIREQLGDVALDLEETESMFDAVRLARRKAKRGEVVLLSPACASFDMYSSYEERGDDFKRQVNNL